MKIAVLSDIHSNVFALEAVLEDASLRGVEQILNLGDIFYGPIAPKATYDLLRKYDFVTILGNQDRQIYEASKEDVDANPTMRFVRDSLGDEPVTWMKSLPFDTQFNDDIYMCHGTPTSDLIYLLEDINTGSPCLRPENEIVELLDGQSSNVVVCGHTHIPRTVKIGSGQVIVNPGSVGLPAYTDNEPVLHSMENYCPHASYAILEKTTEGWTIQQLKVSYPYLQAVRKAQEQQREDWAHFLSSGRGL